MSKSNKISATFPQADQESVITKITDAKELMPFLINLTNDDRKKLRKMGPKSLDFVRLAIQGAKTFPAELKTTFDTAEMEKDYNLLNNLLGVQMACKALAELIDDTMMAAGIDAMDAANEVYASLKLSARGNANVKSIVDQMSENYKGRGKKKTEQPT